MSDILESTRRNASTSYVPYMFKADGPYGHIIQKVDSLYQSVKEFLRQNLIWLKEPGGIKNLLIKLPDAIVSISKRIGPATRIPGKIINVAAEILMPIHKLGGNASSLLGFAEVITKFPAMFSRSENHVKYVVKDAERHPYPAQFPLYDWEQKSNNIQNIANWTLSFTGCAGYIWRLNHTTAEKFPLASLATWSGRYISIKDLYFEGRFLYETLWVGNHQWCDEVARKRTPFKETPGFPSHTTVAWEEVAGSVLRISLSVACLSLDIFKALAAKGNSSPWLDTAIFCAGLAPTFITPVAMRYWPRMVVEPLRAAASA